MTSPRITRIAALAAGLAALATAGPATAATRGVTGYVTDADTGLPLAQASLTWNGATAPAPVATTDGQGRFLFAGLQPGEQGALDVKGPAGWDRLAVGGLSVPDDRLLQQNIELHRDWASTAGG
ncbi:MAG TPA: carboxypeptidase regulatory-like domain-containing protein, partial [Crenalkalicoccus sp.]|nr:carboxypeptidase regulatory-like domain-containing protein [Crenalkalicoccus sp.]